ncbi:hydroxymethylglutaryl-CoA reductase, degradative family protein [Tritrichomonas foetus]|uniref:3-hydroxy-3-methylglutaryl coenzyme A reductase n=1 Tax=Tritrichomonas foetus TaxID=1144522 RepID=A0A1J4JFW2_9EUKA|nr:hydroxymethylglutaryl-CoA reductase, degradative family protein [Tritrichomonas foetus]|eukprot:OHS97183.1 hydroxymethylglutaryl-CoA reductase, degradative family protein [Tritrichomonas foetus]
MEMTSAMPGFFKLPLEERIARLSAAFDLTDEDLTAIRELEAQLSLDSADTMIENCISRHITPVGVATNFIIDGKEVIIPYATEEPSVIAAASLAAKLARPTGGFTTASGSNVCSGQITFIAPSSSPNHLIQLKKYSHKILEVANETMPSMVARTGGANKVDISSTDTESGLILVVELHVKVGDSMGANIVTQACEAVSKFIKNELNLEPLMSILTNMAEKRIVHARAAWPIKDLSTKEYSGYDVANRIIMATNFAKANAHRAATHRKGIMNGISAVVLATGNDTRAVESAIHSYANMDPQNLALTSYRIDDNQNLIGEIWVPIPVGIVGGSINRSATVKSYRKMMKVEYANDLARTIAAVGLAQNFAALRALVTQGISAGHMKLHSRNIACEAGAEGDEIEAVAAKLVTSGKISVTKAKDVLRQMRCQLT